MIVTTRHGRRLTIPPEHPVFTPVGDYHDGDAVDFETVDVEPINVRRLQRGERIIVDNKVEVVADVVPA